MAISISGRIIKVYLKDELKRVSSKKTTKDIANHYSHFRIQFSDGADRHFLFTDKQIDKAYKTSSKKLKEDIKLSWVKELWFEGLADIGIDEIKKDIQKNNLPKMAKKLNHIRINLHDKSISLLFSDKDIESAMEKAKQEEKYLPKVSWLSDFFKDIKWQEQVKKKEQKKNENEIISI